MVQEIKDETKKEATDPFADLSKLRMSQDFADEIGIEKIITKIPVGRPGNQWWVRVHKDPAYRFETAVPLWPERCRPYQGIRKGIGE